MQLHPWDLEFASDGLGYERSAALTQLVGPGLLGFDKDVDFSGLSVEMLPYSDVFTKSSVDSGQGRRYATACPGWRRLGLWARHIL